ncbi:MAG: hypothetical protein D3903_18060, partial [Candidatus Electrothrix sp. GM3_4]|nr:hypothetical protein [Candidatus Electrothrix sp. GM3_4]
DSSSNPAIQRGCVFRVKGDARVCTTGAVINKGPLNIFDIILLIVVQVGPLLVTIAYEQIGQLSEIETDLEVLSRSKAVRF